MRTPLIPLLAPLLAGSALLALSACAETEAVRPMASMSPLELVGLTVQSADGTRLLGVVDDVVVTPDRRPVQAIVASGAPLYPTERRIAVDTEVLRYSSERQALVLTGMTPEQFATRPEMVGGDRMTPLGSVGATGATNWSGVAPAR